jgi:chromosome segregation ATPase
VDGVDVNLIERREARDAFVKKEKGFCRGRAVKNLTYIPLVGSSVLSITVSFYPYIFPAPFLRAISGVAGSVLFLSALRICYLQHYTLDKQVLFLDKQVTDLEKENTQLKKTLCSLRAVSSEIALSSVKYEAQIKQLLKYSEKGAAELSRLNEILLSREEQIEQLALSNEKLQGQLEILKKIIKGLEEENEKLKQNNKVFSNEEKEFDEDVNRLDQEVDELDETNQVLKEQVQQMTSLVKKSADLKKALLEMTEGSQEDDEVIALLKKVLDKVTQEP